MNLFGKKKPPAPNMNESILKLRETINQLGKREEFLQKQADQCLEAAKQKSKKKDKRGTRRRLVHDTTSVRPHLSIRVGALFELKRKKMFEKQIDQMFGKRVNLETQIFALESAATNREVITAMQHGKNAIDQSMKSLYAARRRLDSIVLIAVLAVMWTMWPILWTVSTTAWQWSRTLITPCLNRWVQHRMPTCVTRCCTPYRFVTTVLGRT